MKIKKPKVLILTEPPDTDSEITKIKIMLPKKVVEGLGWGKSVFINRADEGNDNANAFLIKLIDEVIILYPNQNPKSQDLSKPIVTHSGEHHRAWGSGGGIESEGHYFIKIPSKLFEENKTIFISARFRGRKSHKNADIYIEKLESIK